MKNKDIITIQTLRTLANIDSNACIMAGFPTNHGMEFTEAVKRCNGMAIPIAVPENEGKALKSIRELQIKQPEEANHEPHNIS